MLQGLKHREATIAGISAPGVKTREATIVGIRAPGVKHGEATIVGIRAPGVKSHFCIPLCTKEQTMQGRAHFAQNALQYSLRQRAR